ncbi:MAG: DUF1559 domain-containing protein [Planctomycetia bacterium]|nr:DUF1559 domain-containing protein [Planctomycetia bacterium]
MNTMIRFGMVAALVAAAGIVRGADEKPLDAAARAKVIAPFLEEQTVAILHVDFTRLDLGATLDEVVRLVPETQPQMAVGKAAGTATLAAFNQAGGRDVYIFVTLAGSLSEIDLLYVVLPLSPGANQDVLAGMVRQCNPPAFAASERVGDVLMVGSRATINRLKSLPPVSERKISPDIEKAFAAAGDTAAQLLVLPPEYSRRVIAEMMPTLPEEVGGGPSSVLTDGLRWAAVGVDLPPKLALRVTIQSKDNAAAEALEKELAVLWQKLGENEEVRRSVPDLQRTAKVLAPQAQGDRLVLVLDEAHQGAAALVDALRPPYLEEKALYDQFHLDEPWDSPNNKKLIDRMSSAYRSPGSKLTEPGRTNYVVAVGQGTVFGEKEGVKIKDITDGTSNTLMLVEVDDDHAVIWTKPDDLPFDPKQPNKGLGGLWGDDSFLTTFCDGSVRVIKRNVDPETLRRLFIRNDGQPVKDF